MPLEMYIPVVLVMVLALGFVASLIVLGKLFGPKRVSAEKLSPFECGMDPIGSPRVRFSVRFYHVAILFLVFDIEAALMYPWAVNFVELSRTAQGQPSLFGFAEMLVFVVVLLVALAYVWRKKAIGWD